MLLLIDTSLIVTAFFFFSSMYSRSSGSIVTLLDLKSNPILNGLLSCPERLPFSFCPSLYLLLRLLVFFSFLIAYCSMLITKSPAKSKVKWEMLEESSCCSPGWWWDGGSCQSWEAVEKSCMVMASVGTNSWRGTVWLTYVFTTSRCLRNLLLRGPYPCLEMPPFFDSTISKGSGHELWQSGTLHTRREKI